MKTLSFRDPVSKVYISEKNIIRILNDDQYIFYKDLRDKFFIKELINEKLIQDFSLDNHEKQKIMKHAVIDNFVEANEMSSYQLYLSGIHTLDILIKSLESGYIIKDASAWNVVFSKGKPLFLDIGSFEKWDGKSVWNAYGQFVRHYIVPLIVNKETGINISSIFNNNIDGIDPFKAKNILGARVFKAWINVEFIFLPSLFEGKKIKEQKKSQNSLIDNELNLKVIIKIIKRLKNKLKSLKPNSKSFWSRYTHQREHYSEKDIDIKKKIFTDFIENRSGNLLDIGCNTGEFLELSLKNKNITPFGIDYDEDCINYIQEKFKNSNITLSCINFSNPQNSIGWNNSETKGYLNKNKLFYDVVIFFGIAHHLMITHRIPILSILEILSNLTKEYIVFEFVDNLDPKFQHLAGKNINLYKNYTKDNFEKDLSCYFEIINVFCYENNKHRFVYILKKKIN